MNQFDRDIFKSIKGYSRQSPQDLTGILASVDASQRAILTQEELSSGLARLIAAGQVEEAGNGRYFVHESPASERHFSGVSKAEYDRACKAYHEIFSEALEGT